MHRFEHSIKSSFISNTAYTPHCIYWDDLVNTQNGIVHMESRAHSNDLVYLGSINAEGFVTMLA